jgi:hypothetical protein
VASLLRGFAAHKRQAGQPDDYWLPPEVYDEQLCSVDGLYLYIISDGSVGGPRPKRDASSDLSESCGVCDPKKAGADRAAIVAHLAASMGSSAKSAVGLDTLAISLGLEHLQPLVESIPLADATAELKASRPAFLARLKAAGVEKLADRQKLTNGLSKAARESNAPGKAYEPNYT